MAYDIKNQFGRSKTLSNYIPTEKTKKRISISMKKAHEEGRHKNGFTKGQEPWNKGLIGFRAGIPRHQYTESWKEKALAPLKEYYKTHEVWNKGKKGYHISIENRNILPPLEKHKRLLEYQRRYRKGKGRLNNRLYKIKRRYKEKNIIHDFTKEEWCNKINKTNGICPACNVEVGIQKLTMDHINPISEVQAEFIYTINDVQPLCKNCNSSKNTQVIQYV